MKGEKYMSLNTFKKMQQDPSQVFTNEKDGAALKDFEKSLDKVENKKTSSRKEVSLNLTPKNSDDTLKRPISFSLTGTELKKFDSLVDKNGFKNRSEMLSAIIDQLEL